MHIKDITPMDIAVVLGGPARELVEALEWMEVKDNDTIIADAREEFLEELRYSELAHLMPTAEALMPDYYDGTLADHRTIVDDAARLRLVDVSPLFPDRDSAYVNAESLIDTISGRLDELDHQFRVIDEAMQCKRDTAVMVSETGLERVVTRICNVPDVEVEDIELHGVYSRAGNLMGIEVRVGDYEITVDPELNGPTKPPVMLLVAACIFAQLPHEEWSGSFTTVID